MMRRRVRREGPMRVLFVVPFLRPGGAERHVATLLPAMDPERFAPSVVCIGEEGELFARLVHAGVPARALNRSRSGLAVALWELVKHMRTVRPDIVVVHGFNAEVLGRAAAVLARVPRSVVWVHQCSEIRPRGTLQRWLETVLRPMTTAYFGVAYAQVRYLTQELGHPRAKVRIIQNGADPEEFRFAPIPERGTEVARSLGVGRDDLVVGIIAAMRPEKDHETFLRAARIVSTRVPKARFLLVGRGPLYARTVRMADELGIGDKVIFTGMREDVPDLLALLDLFALTSTTECFPMSILEAMAAGKPTVCTAVGGIPEIVDDGSTGYLVPPSSPAVLAGRIVELLGDQERMREMGKAGRARMEAEFGLARSVREAEHRLDEVAGRSHWTNGGR